MPGSVSFSSCCFLFCLFGRPSVQQCQTPSKRPVKSPNICLGFRCPRSNCKSLEVGSFRSPDKGHLGIKPCRVLHAKDQPKHKRLSWARRSLKRGCPLYLSAFVFHLKPQPAAAQRAVTYGWMTSLCLRLFPPYLQGPSDWYTVGAHSMLGEGMNFTLR